MSADKTFDRKQLKALRELSPEQIKTLGQIAQVIHGGTTRRNVLGALAGLGIGSAASYSAVETASAGASTSDGDGNMGTPSDPNDFFADGVNIFDGPNNQIGSLDETGLNIPSVSTEEIGGTLEVGDGDSIEDTINNAADEAIEVRVRPDWDPSVESFPIQIYTGDNPPVIRGPGMAATDPKNNGTKGSFFDLGGVAAAMFELIGEESDGTEHNWAPNAVIDGFAVTGCDHLVTLEDVDMARLSNLYGYSLTDHGFLIKSSSTSNLWNLFDRCFAIEGTGSGFFHSDSAKANATVYIGCHSRDNSDYGIRNSVSDSHVIWIGGDLSNNGNYGWLMKGEMPVLYGAYLENNDEGNFAEVNIQDSNTATEGAIVEACRGQGASSVGRMVYFNNAVDCTVRSITGKSYTSGIVDYGASQNDCDARDVSSLDSTALVADVQGTRPRWEGVIGGGPLGGVDLSTVTGQHDNDLAVSNGQSAAPGHMACVWDANNSYWVYPTRGGTV